jgi:hypothetical protein
MNNSIKIAATVTVISVLLNAFFFLSAFNEKEKKVSLDELSIKRINIISEDGSLRMVLSNEIRQHPGRIDGKDLPKRERGAGILYFNYDGDECGGLLYGNMTKDSITNSVMSFTMDQYKQDQVIQLVNSEYIEKGKAVIEKGLVVNEYPVGSNLGETMQKIAEFEKIANEKERNLKIEQYMKENGGKNRMFLGRTGENNTGLFLKAPDGKTKIKLYVDSKGNPVIEVLNRSGKFVNILGKGY